jgi:hypothetical protein
MKGTHEQVAKDMIAVRIGPDARMAVVGAPFYFEKRSFAQWSFGFYIVADEWGEDVDHNLIQTHTEIATRFACALLSQLDNRAVRLAGRKIMKFSVMAAILLTLFLITPTARAQMGQPMPGVVTKSTFQLFPNPKFLTCLSGAKGTPSAKVTVVQGKLNDTLVLKLSHVKPNLGFDLFTTQRTNLLSDGTLDANFTNFGLSWYQSDVQANKQGSATVKIQTILVDQIFGFDPDVALAPTNTFHVGIWFNNPADATACGFTGTTPFNGDHNAGPNAMMSEPGADELGPLCLNPSGPGVCNP